MIGALRFKTKIAKVRFSLQERVLTLAMILMPITQIGHWPSVMRPGVMLLMVFCVMSWVANTSRFHANKQVLLSVWLFLLLGFGIGAANNYFFHAMINPTTLHDSSAYALIVLMLFSVYQSDVRLEKCVTNAAFFLPIFFVFIKLFSIGHYWGPRYMGLSQNPNQFALALVCLPWIILRSYKTLTNKYYFLVPVSLVASVYLAVATRSHAVFVSWSGLGVLAVSGFLVKKLQPLKYAWAVYLGLSLLLVALVLVIIDHFSVFLALIHLKRSEPFERITLWQEGLKLAADSYLLGLGPGSYLVAPNHLQMPFYEAHDVFVDLLIQGGVLAASAFIYLLYRALVVTRNDRYKMGVLTIITIFSCFHFTLRQPIVWLYFAWLLEP